MKNFKNMDVEEFVEYFNIALHRSLGYENRFGKTLKF